MMRIFVIPALLLITSLSSGQVAKQAKPVPLFFVGPGPVYTDEFVYLYNKNYSNRPEEYTEEKINEYLDLYIKFKLKVAEAVARGMDSTSTFRKEFASYKAELKKPYLAESDDLDRLVKEAYDHLTWEVKVSHILLMVRPDAPPADTLSVFNKISEIRRKAVAGVDFGKLANDFSEDPGAKASGGDLGYFTGFQFVYPFEKAAFHTPVGQISPPVRTRFGYHLIKVLDRQPAHGEVEVSHIFLSNRNGNEAKAKKTIFEIDDQLKGARSWDELCAEYSDDAATKNTGGRLRPFGVRGMDVPEFEKVAFTLQKEGDISDPFASSMGWHIIRLEKKIPVPPFKEMESALRRKVSRDDRLTISKAVRLNKNKLEYGFAESDVKSVVFALGDSNLTKGKWKFSGDSNLKGKTLFTLKNKQVTVKEFITYAETNQTPTSLSPVAYMGQLYDGFTEEKINELEDELLQTQHPDLRRLLNEYREGILLFSIMEHEVWAKASGDSAGQHGFYNQNPTRYTAGDRLDARIFSTADKTFFEEAKDKIHKGDTLSVADMKRFKSVQNFRAFEKGENKVVDKISWSIGLHETEADGIYYLVEVKRLIPPGPKSFIDARAQVISDYQDHLEKEWVAQLKQKYPVKINAKGKKLVMNELKKK